MNLRTCSDLLNLNNREKIEPPPKKHKSIISRAITNEISHKFISLNFQDERRE